MDSITALEALRPQLDAIDHAMAVLREEMIKLTVPPPPPDVTSFEEFFAKWDPEGEVGKRKVSVVEYSYTKEDAQKKEDLAGLNWSTTNSESGSVTIYESAPVLLIKFTDASGGPAHGGRDNWSLPVQNADGTWTPGDWREVSDNIVTCRNALHMTSLLFAERWTSDRAFVVEVDGPVMDAGQKFVARRVRLLREIDLPEVLEQIVKHFSNDPGKAIEKVVDIDLRTKMQAMTFASVEDVLDYLRSERHELEAQKYEALAASVRAKTEKELALANSRRESLDRSISQIAAAEVAVKDSSRALSIRSLVDKKIATKGEIVRVRDEILTKTFGVPIAELGELPSSIS